MLSNSNINVNFVLKVYSLFQKKTILFNINYFLPLLPKREQLFNSKIEINTF